MTIARTKDGRVWSSIYPIAPCPQCEEPIELRALPHYASTPAGMPLKNRAGQHRVEWYEVDIAANCECYEVAGYSDAEEEAIASIAAEHYRQTGECQEDDPAVPYRLLSPAEYPQWLQRRRHQYANFRVG